MLMMNVYLNRVFDSIDLTLNIFELSFLVYFSFLSAFLSPCVLAIVGFLLLSKDAIFMLLRFPLNGIDS